MKLSTILSASFLAVALAAPILSEPVERGFFDKAIEQQKARLAAEQAAREKAQQEQIARQKAITDKLLADQAAAAKAAAEKAAAEKAAADAYSSFLNAQKGVGAGIADAQGSTNSKKVTEGLKGLWG